MFKTIKNWLHGGEITLLKLKNELLEDGIENLNKTIHDLQSKLFSAETNYNLLADDYKKKISEKIGNFSEKIDSVRGYKVAVIYKIMNNNIKSIVYDSVNEAAYANEVDGSNLTKKLKETGGNCVIKGIQFVLVKI